MDRSPDEACTRQIVAAACIFLASKTEECGRKLRDVARVVCAKSKQPSLNYEEIPPESRVRYHTVFLSASLTVCAGGRGDRSRDLDS